VRRTTSWSSAAKYVFVLSRTTMKIMIMQRKSVEKTWRYLLSVPSPWYVHRCQ